MAIKVLETESHEEGIYKVVTVKGLVIATGFYSLIDAIEYITYHNMVII